MAYNSLKVLARVEKGFLAEPGVRLSELARQLKYSHPTIEKPVFRHTSPAFCGYQKKKLIERGFIPLQHGYKARKIGKFLGYKWPENFLRFVKESIGCSLCSLSFVRIPYSRIGPASCRCFRRFLSSQQCLDIQYWEWENNLV